MLNQNHRNALKQAISKRGLDIAEASVEHCFEFLELLFKWNTVHNLTAIQDPMEMMYSHVVDSLTLYPSMVRAPIHRILDVGTGAGLPGLVLAICAPHLTFVLLDSQQKKINFVQHVILSLKLENVSVVCSRVEAYQPSEGFDWVISRAFASLGVFAKSAGHLVKDPGYLVAMKANVSKEEALGLPDFYTIDHYEAVTLETKESRCLVFIKKK